MIEILLVAALAALIGGCAGGVGGAILWSKDNRDLEAALDDLDDRLLSWQRKVTKRARDDGKPGPGRATLPQDGRSPEDMTYEERKRAILDRAAQNPLMRGRPWAS